MRHGFDQLYSHAGQKAEVFRDGVKVAEPLVLFHDVSPKVEEAHISTMFECELKAGDKVHLTESDATFEIKWVERKVFAGDHIGWDGYIDTPKSLARAQRAGPSHSISIGTNYGIVGSQQHAIVNLSLAAEQIEKEIESKGGQDSPDLRLALAEFRHMLETKNEVPRGALSRFEGAIERHSWFSGALAGLALNYLLGKITGTM